ncbi:IS3 family transposase, partial [Synechococcus moorigangaii CMS01]|nr:IS3 family transposase [Synechococcus moorigangaii CMS01]
MSKKARRYFTPEQKAQAVQIVQQSDKSITQIALEMGLTESALRKWVKTAQMEAEAATLPKPLTHDERQELQRLRRELKRVQMERDFLKKAGGLLCQGKQRRYELIEAEKEEFPVRMMCRILQVSRSGYYGWRQRKPSLRMRENEMLSREIEHIHQESQGTYGAPRIRAALWAKGYRPIRYSFARLMKLLGIGARRKRRYKATTDANHRLAVAPNTLQRDFKTTEPDRVWVSDITYLQTAQGWLYLAVIIDLFSRRVVGWSMAEHLRTELVLTALNASLGHRRPCASGLLIHSDRGSQYASHDYQKALSESGILCSMSRRGNCWDNAVAESFFGTLKSELIKTQIFPSRSQARTTVAEWIEVFDNRQRIHSANEYLSPVQFENE